MRTVILAFALSMVTTPALAQPRSTAEAASDAALIETCLREGRQDQGSCSGNYGPCVAAYNDGGSRRALMYCAEREVAAWQVVLEHTAIRLRALENETGLRLLEEALRTAPPAENARCAYEADAETAPELGYLRRQECMMALVPNRVLSLWQRAEAMEDEARRGYPRARE